MGTAMVARNPMNCLVEPLEPLEPVKMSILGKRQRLLAVGGRETNDFGYQLSYLFRVIIRNKDGTEKFWFRVAQAAENRGSSGSRFQR
jgi:hypothetical protein